MSTISRVESLDAPLDPLTWGEMRDAACADDPLVAEWCDMGGSVLNTAGPLTRWAREVLEGFAESAGASPTDWEVGSATEAQDALWEVEDCEAQLRSTWRSGDFKAATELAQTLCKLNGCLAQATITLHDALEYVRTHRQ